MLYFPKKMTHREVPAFANELWQQTPQTGKWDLSLEKVEVLDSALLALLLAVLRLANTKNLTLQLHGLPSGAKALLGVYGILTLFEKHLV